MDTKLRVALLLALGTAIISGTSNFLAKIAVTVVKDPVVFTFLKNGIVALLLLGLLLGVSRRRELRALTARQWGKLLAIGVIGGSVPFVLFFTGLQHTSALSASFIHKTLFIWVTLLAVPFLKERISRVQFAALALLFGGTLALGIPRISWGTGELMVLGATLLWAVENIIAKRTLADLSGTVVAAGRMVFGSVILLGIVAAQGHLSLVTSLSAAQWGWTLLPAALLTGYVLTWYAALKRAPASLVASLLVPAVFVTNALSSIFLTHTLPLGQAVSGILVSLGAALLIAYARRTSPHGHALPTER